MKKQLTGFPWFMAFFAVYPVLTLFAANLREVEADVFYRPLLLSIVFAGLVFGIVALFIRARVRAALVTSFLGRLVDGRFGCIEPGGGVLRLFGHGQAYILDDVFHAGLNGLVAQAPPFVLAGAFQC